MWSVVICDLTGQCLSDWWVQIKGHRLHSVSSTSEFNASSKCHLCKELGKICWKNSNDCPACLQQHYYNLKVTFRTQWENLFIRGHGENAWMRFLLELHCWVFSQCNSSVNIFHSVCDKWVYYASFRDLIENKLTKIAWFLINCKSFERK